MKAIQTIILSLVLTNAASASVLNNTVENNISNIKNRVRECAILPYHYKNNNRVDHAILSHCPEVKVLPAVEGYAPAKIRVAGHVFTAALLETVYSDGDMFDVEIRDIVSSDSFKMTNVLAFGDVLLGVLDGSTNGINPTLVNQ